MSNARIGLDRKTRALTLTAVAALHIAVIAALISAFGVEVVVQSVKSIAAFDVPAPPPPSPPPPPAEPVAQAVQPQGAAAPPAPKATPRPRPSPIPRIVVAPKPTQIVASTGTAVKSGTSAAGTGSAGGGQGSGTGSGIGSGGGVVRRAEKVSGELRTRDFPRSGADRRDGRFIVVRYAVGTDGRVKNCRVVQSSGSAEADAITCGLIERRFRYRPAEDAAGNPVGDETGWKQWWWRPA